MNIQQLFQSIQNEKDAFVDKTEWKRFLTECRDYIIKMVEEEENEEV